MNGTEARATAYNPLREWLLWIAAMAGGWLIGTSVNFLASSVVSATGLGAALSADPADIPESTVLIFMGLSLVLLLVVGLSVGALQWLLLRRQLDGLQQWPIFTALGFALGTFAYVAFMGVGVGLMQWLLLRRSLNKSVWWAVINGVSWPLGYILGGALGVTIGAAIGSPLLANLLSAVLAGAIIGAITGAVLLWLLRENAALLESLRHEKEAAP